MIRRLAGVALVVVFVARHDLWWWDDASRPLGIPIGLLWHVGICVVASALLAAWVLSADRNPGRRT